MFMLIILLEIVLIGFAIDKASPVGRSQEEKKKTRIIGICVLIVLFTAGGYISYLVYRFQAKSFIPAADSNAKQICNAFQNGVVLLKGKKLLPEEQPEIIMGDFSHQPEENTPEYYIHQFISADAGFYVIVLKENWSADYVLWSKTEITPDEIHPVTESEQKEIINSLRIPDDTLIGCYQPRKS
ncbi:MAG: hypothetical protein E7496_03825 [Ruminococcus sp.]|nr:hypothetical protein [Ruminococcus sp.]